MQGCSIDGEYHTSLATWIKLDLGCISTVQVDIATHMVCGKAYIGSIRSLSTRVGCAP